MRSAFVEIFILINSLKKLRIYQIIGISFLILISGIAEVFTISSFLPLIMLVSSDNNVLVEKYPFLNNIGIDPSLITVSNTSIVFIMASIFSFFMVIFSKYSLYKFSASVGTELTILTQKSLFQKEYLYFVENNSNERISKVMFICNNAANALTSVLDLSINIFLAFSILIALLNIDFKVTIIIFLITLLYYILIGSSVKNILNRIGSKKIKLWAIKYGLVKSIDDNTIQIKLTPKIDFILNKLGKFDYSIRTLNNRKKLISIIPRYLLETLLLISFALLLTLQSISGRNPSLYLPTLVTIAFGAQKVIPILQATYSSWSNLLETKASISELLKLDITNHIYKKSLLSMKSNIKFKSVSFSYTKEARAIDDLNLIINKGEKIAIIGESGSGKTTLLLMLLGMLKPKEGIITIDDINLKKENGIEYLPFAGYVPQSINLSEGSFNQIIAFDYYNSLDRNKVVQIAKVVGIDSLIKSRGGYDQVIGDDASKLSGGQRQRIAIARSLYQNPDYYVLDEPTSALDKETESWITNSLLTYLEDKTVIVVTHSKELMQRMDRVIEIKDGKLISDKYS